METVNTLRQCFSILFVIYCCGWLLMSIYLYGVIASRGKRVKNWPMFVIRNFFAWPKLFWSWIREGWNGN